MIKPFETLVVAIGFLFLLAPAACALDETDIVQNLTRTEFMIPMRDGAHLYTVIFRPSTLQPSLPFLLFRTPYGVDDNAQLLRALNSAYIDLVRDGYIFVFQDIRGRFKSEGKFVLLHPLCEPETPQCLDEATDASDSVDWLVRNVPNNTGRVGVLGISYGGWTTMMALLSGNPAIKAVSPQASCIDIWLGDDYFHNGAFRLGYAFRYEAAMERSKGITRFQFDMYDLFDWYVNLGPLSNVNKLYFHEQATGWNDLVAHPNYDEYWQKLSLFPALKKLKKLTVPVLNVGGWWDQEDLYGALAIYEELEKKDADHLNYLVEGPWSHGSWARPDGQKLGDIEFGSDTARYFREKIQAPWFAYWLKDQGNLPFQSTAHTFQTGKNKWQSHDEWPPRQKTVPRNLFFHANGNLSFDSPSETNPPAFDSYFSDPRNPVPFLPRPVRDDSWSSWMVQDQRFAANRPDVVSWKTEALSQDITITGDITAHLFASTSGTDSDWVVKLIDVYPQSDPSHPGMGGYQLMVASEIFRGRFRNNFAKPQAIPSNAIVEYNVDLHPNDHSFLEGHQIMVQIQSTWFPLYDPNPQQYVPNVFLATPDDFRASTQKVYRTKQFPSNIELPVSVP